MGEKRVEPESAVFADDGTFLNSPLPVLVYRGVEGKIEEIFAANGWPPEWTDTVFPYHHYHSTAHEVLGVVSGMARIRLGGPEGKTFDLVAGDVVVIPAGVAHKRESASTDFAVAGAYPPGQSWDLLKGEKGDREKALGNIAKVELPESDPVAGAGGPLVRLWRSQGDEGETSS